MNKKYYSFAFLFTFLSFSVLAQTVSISGVITRHNSVPEEGVTVHCTNANDVVTGADGVFTFTDLPSGEDYVISATKESDPNEFITVLDALKTADIVLDFANGVSPFQILAADVNNSSIVSTIDIVELLKIADKIQGITNPNYWRIFGSDFSFAGGCVFQGTPAECIGIFLGNVTEDVDTLEMIATKLGDVAIDADHFPPPVDAPEPVLYFQDKSVAQDEEFEVEIFVEDFIKIAGFQHTLSWDPAILELLSIENPLDYNLLANEDFSDQGLLPALGTMSNTLEGVTIDDGSVLYSLRFKALSDVPSLSGMLDFTEDIIQQQMVYRPEEYELYLLNHHYESAVTTSNEEITSLENFEAYPNPIENHLMLNASFEHIEKAEVSLINSVGQIIQRWNFEENSIHKQLNLNDLPKGVYVLKLSTDDGLLTKSLVKL